MADKKIYSIQINGIQESVNAVEALNAQLKTLEARIKALENSSVKVNAGGSSSSNSSSASEEAAVQREINKLKAEGANLDAKIAAAQDEVYKRVDATKQLYKETIADQKAMAAQERLTADAYSNTMQGMKSQLADLKAVINTTDLGDGDSIKKMTQQANELTNKLKEMEQSYGQFGRNVGNYANGVADGLQKVRVAVGDDVREFDNAKQAAKALGNELKTMAVNGQQGTKEFKDLQKAVAQLNSDIKDATVSSKAMDNLLDTMQSFAAIGSVTQGFSALFGFDDTEIEKSIQKLVALQNVMQGIEKINQQINSQEGIGGWLAKGNSMIDSFVAKITGAAKAQETLNTATKAGAVASEGLAVAQEAQATATASATVATKALSFALKTLGIGLVVTAVAYLVENWKDLYEWLTDTIPALKNISNWFDKIKAVAMGVGSAIVNYMVQPLATLIKVIQAIINGNFSEIPNIISEGFKKTFDLAGNYQKGYNKETENQQKKHNQKMLENQKKANEEWLKDEEAKYGQSYERTKKYLNKQMELINKELANTKKGSKEYDALIQQQKEVQRKIWENERTEKEKNAKKSKELAKKNAKEESEAEKELAELKIANMKEGLNKELKQLEYEKNQRLAKVRSNGIKVGELTLEIEKLYATKEKRLREQHAKDVEKIYIDMWTKIRQAETDAMMMGLDTEFTKLDNKLEDEISKLQGKLNSRYASYQIQYPSNMSKQMADSLGVWEMGSDVKGMKDMVTMAKEYLDLLEDIELAKSHAFAWEGDVISTNVAVKNLEEAERALQEWLKIKETTQEDMEDWYIVQELKNKGYTRSLSNAYRIRVADMKKYYSQVEELQKQHESESVDNELRVLEEEWKIQRDGENARFKEQLDSLKENREKLLDEGKDYDALVKAATEAHKNELKALQEKKNAETEKIEIEHGNRMRKITSESLNGRIQEYRDFYTAIGNLDSKQPQLMRGILGDFGIINLSKSRENYKQVLDGYKDLMESLQNEKDKLQEQFDNKEISFDDFQQAKRELNDLEQACADGAQSVKDKLNGLTSEFIVSINQYFQIAMQSVQTILSAVWDAEDAALDKQQDELDKWNDKLDKALDKQQEIIEQHKSAIDSIEDELATSRGDRRQHLIDQLNAEMEAQRAAQIEKERIQKEKERAEKKQEELDKKRKEAEYKRNLTSILVSTAMATANGLATKPFVPVGIAMGALATSLGMVQYALAKANKPYAKGGQLEGGVAVGARHRDGGIPVLGGRASIEGGEFITNRQTTASNIDLLEYINAKHRKLDINDFIDFYSSGKIKKSVISMSPRTKFVDGGQIPTLNNEYQFDDRLLTAFEDYSNRPVYVSVVDINKKQNDVKNIQVLAGLNE